MADVVVEKVTCLLQTVDYATGTGPADAEPYCKEAGHEQG